jgi:GntR family transcriptional regulator, arabinose operon transcriptional repressor
MASKDDSQPLYQRIYQYLSEEIVSGRFRPGDRVPSEKELSEQFEVSRITSKKALEMLSDEGVIERVPGKGSFVAEAVPVASTASRTGRTNGRIIGFVMPDFGDPFGAILIRSIEQACNEIGYHVILRTTHDNADEEEKAIDRLLEIGVDGIIVLPVHGEYYNPLILRLVLDHFPLVFVDRHLRGLAASSVSTDNVMATQMAIDYLIEIGHRCISFVSFPLENTSTVEDRLAGFVRSHAEHGVVIDKSLILTDLGDTWQNTPATAVSGNVERIRAHLAAHPNITAIFADEYTVVEYLREAALQLGRRIPEDLSVICFDSPIQSAGPFPFTHLKQPEYEMGTQAVQMLYDQIANDNHEIKTANLPATLVLGKSTASPRMVYHDIP